MRSIFSLLFVLLFPFLVNGQTLPAVDNYLLTPPPSAVAQGFLEQLKVAQSADTRAEFKDGQLEEGLPAAYVSLKELDGYDPKKVKAEKILKPSTEILYPVSNGQKIVSSISIQLQGQWTVTSFGGTGYTQPYSSLRDKAVKLTGLKSAKFFRVRLPVNRDYLAYLENGELKLFSLQDEILGKPPTARPAEEVLLELKELHFKKPKTN
ncbi:MAG: hypothetical protein K2W82_17215 [Candidatus Obscuribacterales bacterium]|nr:hypothetical protein [Candidatus Obscuribacterales bacterium]